VMITSLTGIGILIFTGYYQMDSSVCQNHKD
jgi:hypothetical protein